MKKPFILPLLLLATTARAAEPKTEHIFPMFESLKIAFLTDIHVQPDLPSDKYIDDVIREVNESDCDFVLLGGDYVFTGYEADIRNVHKHLKKLAKPYFTVLGNHEVIRTDNGCTAFRKLFGYDRRLVFRAGNYKFVGFEAGPYNRATVAIVRDEDLKWLEEQFRSARSDEKIICVCHIPLNRAIANHREVTSLMKKYDVKAQICGHAHTTLMLNVDSLPCAMGRMLDLTDKKWGAGYNIIELKNDSIYLWQKRLDQSEPKLFRTAKQGFSPALLDRKKYQYNPLPEAELDYAETGAVLMKDFRPAVYAGAAVDDKAVYVGHSNGIFSAIDKTDGKELWRFDLGDALCATPVCVDGKVIIVSPTGTFYALDRNDGSIVWKLKAKGAVVGDPAVKDGMIYCSFGVGRFAKIDAAKGKTVWVADSGSKQMQCVPAVGEGRVVISTWENDVRCYDEKTGKQLWRWYCGNDRFDFAPGLIFPHIAHGKVFTYTVAKELAVLDLQSGEPIWRDDLGSCRKAAGISSDGETIYAETRKGDIVALRTDASQYSGVWTAKTKKIEVDRNACEMLSSRGVLYYAPSGGWIVAVRESDGHVLWERRFSQTEANSLRADENGDVWAVFLDGKLFRIPAADLKK